MANVLQQRIPDWLNRVRTELQKTWWGLMILAIIGFIGAMLYSRLVDRANSFVDTHANASLVRPILNLLGNITPSLWHGVLGAIVFVVVGFFGLVIHAYFETRPNLDNEGRAPRLSLGYSQQDAKDFLSKSGLSIKNNGDIEAYTVSLLSPCMGKVRLRFPDMPIQRIDPGIGVPIDVRTDYLSNDGRWCPTGGTVGGQIEGCFDRLDGVPEEKIPVTIEWSDYHGKRSQKSWVIRREGDFLVTRKIWCEIV